MEFGREYAIYFAVKNDAFIEGDAETRTLKRLTYASGEEELLMNFSSINEKIRLGKNNK